MEDRHCASCGERFEPNPRARAEQRYCRDLACQRLRRARAQSARRSDAKRPSTKVRRRRAAYMCAYRAEHDRYRAKEAKRVRAGRRAAKATPAPFATAPGGPEVEDQRVVTEAGSNGRVESLYVEATSSVQVGLRVVTEAGNVVRIVLPIASAERRNEAG